MLFIGNAQVNRQNKAGKIDQNRVSLSRYLPLSPLPLTLLRKVCGEVPDDLNPECESRQSRSTHGPLRNQLPALDLEPRLYNDTLIHLPAVSEWSDFVS